MSPWSDRAGRTVRGPGRRVPSSVNPFDSLEVQMALARLERLIADLEVESGRFARAHHLHAARHAYGQALGEACRLAGVEVVVDGRPLPQDRIETELRSRGWWW